MVLPNQDGQLYESRADKRGICRWYKVKDAVTMPAKLQRPAVHFALSSPDGSLYESQKAPSSVKSSGGRDADDDLLEMLQDHLEAAEQFGKVKLVTPQVFAQLQRNRDYRVFMGQDYLYDDGAPIQLMQIRELANPKTADGEPWVERVVFFDQMEQYQLTPDELDQGLGYMCTGSGCDPIWLVEELY